MNNDSAETIFIETFIAQSKRDRCLFELKSRKKRSDFFSKLCHRYGEILDPRYMVRISPANASSKEIYEMLVREGAEKQCYILSYLENLDGQRMALSEALDNCIGCGMPSIVICIPDKLAYFEAEQEAGPPPRFLLLKR